MEQTACVSHSALCGRSRCERAGWARRALIDRRRHHRRPLDTGSGPVSALPTSSLNAGRRQKALLWEPHGALFIGPRERLNRTVPRGRGHGARVGEMQQRGKGRSPSHAFAALSTPLDLPPARPLPDDPLHRLVPLEPFPTSAARRVRRRSACRMVGILATRRSAKLTEERRQSPIRRMTRLHASGDQPSYSDPRRAMMVGVFELGRSRCSGFSHQPGMRQGQRALGRTEFPRLRDSA